MAQLTAFFSRVTIALCLGLTVAAASSSEKSSKVTLATKRGSVKLQLNGDEYFVRGVGGSTHLDLLAECGGNSIRTWGIGDGTKSLLNEAHKEGLSVTLGIRLQRTGTGMDYTDEAALAQQARRFEQAIKLHRKHPALLIWAIGNEVEGEGNDPAVYEQIERLAQLARELDPDHPTMSVIAEMGGGKKVRDLNRLAPSIDIIGINSYGAAATVGQRYAEAGGVRPYMITEFGPRGHWEVDAKRFDLAVEPTSTEKAKHYRSAYEGSVEKRPLCLGSYAFFWGDKQETTATWYGMLLPDGTRLGCVDTMTELWTGKKPRNECPTVSEIAGVPSKGELEPGENFKVGLRAKDPDGDRLAITWVLRRASAGDGAYGAHEDKMPEIDGAISAQKRTSARVRMPKDPGGYRLFAYVRDGKGGGAVLNVPLQVEAQ